MSYKMVTSFANPSSVKLSLNNKMGTFSRNNYKKSAAATSVWNVNKSLETYVLSRKQWQVIEVSGSDLFTAEQAFQLLS